MPVPDPPEPRPAFSPWLLVMPVSPPNLAMATRLWTDHGIDPEVLELVSFGVLLRTEFEAPAFYDSIKQAKLANGASHVIIVVGNNPDYNLALANQARLAGHFGKCVIVWVSATQPIVLMKHQCKAAA